MPRWDIRSDLLLHRFGFFFLTLDLNLQGSVEWDWEFYAFILPCCSEQ